jgi:hypothetical protein
MISVREFMTDTVRCKRRHEPKKTRQKTRQDKTRHAKDERRETYIINAVGGGGRCKGKSSGGGGRENETKE